ncbi:MAG: lysylphosphatidylglycerol synthase domain-containing protein [Myxococcota bacterium]
MRFLRFGRRVLPACVAVATIGYVFTRVPLVEAWSAAREAEIRSLVPLILAATLFWFLIESAAYAKLFSRFNAKLSWREARSLRGLSYLLTPIHLSLGKVGIVLRYATLKKISPLEVTSTVALYQTFDAIVLASLAAIGLSLVPEMAISHSVQLVTLLTILVLTGYLMLIRFARPASGLGLRVQKWTLHRSHRTFGSRDVLLMLSVKLAYHLAFVAVFYLGARAFGVELPFSIALAATPIIQAIGALPISPAGLGTQQAAMLIFFSEYGSEGAIVAFGFSLTAALISARCLLGLAYLPSLNPRSGEP